jgi:AcrR family transcriptional regulator
MRRIRTRILEAARRCFNRQGLHSTTIRDIGAEASLSIGGLYTHFRSKAEIIEAMFDGGDADNMRLFDGAPAERFEVEGFTRKALTVVGDPNNRAQVRISLLFQAEALHNPAIAARLQQQHAALVGQLVAAMCRDQAVRPEQARTRALLILAAIEGLKPQLFADPDLDVPAYIACTLEKLVE